VALAISPALALSIVLDGFRVGLPVLARVIGMAVAPFLLAVPADLAVLGIGVELVAMIFPVALPLAIGSTANKLVGVITGKLKQLLATAAAAIIHQAAPELSESAHCAHTRRLPHRTTNLHLTPWLRSSCRYRCLVSQSRVSGESR